MERLNVIKDHLSYKHLGMSPGVVLSKTSAYLKQTTEGGQNVEIKPPPLNYEEYYNIILTDKAVQFVAELVVQFDVLVEEMLNNRMLKKLEFDRTGSLPNFQNKLHTKNQNWTVKPVPRRLKCRHIDLGDVSPSNTSHFVKALRADIQGIQTDFDDGHCPTWSNQILGLYNVYQAVHNNIKGVPSIDKAPVLMMRPRAWNMIEHNLLVNGKEVPGPLFDFGLLMYHNAKILLDNESGPYFYLSKLEGSKEAQLWDKIFTWTEQKLSLNHGCIKACVLIENIFASFEMEDILYELRDHSAGLNCGIWDYSASFINKFGHRPEFVLPDRNKYVSMDRHFLKSYMDLVVKTCHKHGCHATGGMAALILPDVSKSNTSYQQIVQKVVSGKKKEIEAGVDGFMVYEKRLVGPMQELFRKMSPSANQLTVLRCDVNVTAADLLKMPSGSVTYNGLKQNITVGILFIEAWLRGQGHYFFKGAVEDSATAEISRSQAHLIQTTECKQSWHLQRFGNGYVTRQNWKTMG
ncbi:hypothetical protein KUTeg_024703 [Tegillarca granosa]|uniref:malate synthase n=1 Tax=Tegillarca granosa TaxID=220873 RepID=A0ABQ9E2S8_TEGGR|nr:hypothetical protein KUTeg_024703 [Tegillarca granosa]